MTEAQLSASFVKQMRQAGWHTQKFEDKYSVGIPDVNVCKDGMEAWIELKVAKMPIRTSSLMDTHIRDYQKSWNLTRTMCGGRCYLLIGIEKKVYLLRWKDIFQISSDYCTIKNKPITKELILTASVSGRFLWLHEVPEIIYNDLESWNNA